jgi:hypothetical protein
MAIVLISVKARSSTSFSELGLDTMQLAAGDRVARIVSNYRGSQRRVVFHLVERTTPTQIILTGSHSRYRRVDGSEIGGNSGFRGSRDLLPPNSPEVLALLQDEVTRKTADRVAELLAAKFTTTEARLKALREVELSARQAAERVELLERQIAEAQELERRLAAESVN